MSVLARWVDARLAPFGVSLPAGVYGASSEVLFKLVEVGISTALTFGRMGEN